MNLTLKPFKILTLSFLLSFLFWQCSMRDVMKRAGRSSENTRNPTESTSSAHILTKSEIATKAIIISETLDTDYDWDITYQGYKLSGDPVPVDCTELNNNPLFNKIPASNHNVFNLNLKTCAQEDLSEFASVKITASAIGVRTNKSYCGQLASPDTDIILVCTGLFIMTPNKSNETFVIAMGEESADRMITTTSENLIIATKEKEKEQVIEALKNSLDSFQIKQESHLLSNENSMRDNPAIDIQKERLLEHDLENKFEKNLNDSFAERKNLFNQMSELDLSSLFPKKDYRSELAKQFLINFISSLHIETAQKLTNIIKNLNEISKEKIDIQKSASTLIDIFSALTMLEYKKLSEEENHATKEQKNDLKIEKNDLLQTIRATLINLFGKRTVQNDRELEETLSENHMEKLGSLAINTTRSTAQKLIQYQIPPKVNPIDIQNSYLEKLKLAYPQDYEMVSFCIQFNYTLDISNDGITCITQTTTQDSFTLEFKDINSDIKCVNGVEYLVSIKSPSAGRMLNCMPLAVSECNENTFYWVSRNTTQNINQKELCNCTSSKNKNMNWIPQNTDPDLDILAFKCSTFLSLF